MGAQQAEECARRGLSKFSSRSFQVVSPPQMYGLSDPQMAKSREQVRKTGVFRLFTSMSLLLI